MKKMLHIVKDSATSLRSRSIEIPEPISDDYIALAGSMLDYLKMSQDEEARKKYQLRGGVGLAAPQIGRNVRLIVVYYPMENSEGDIVFVQHVLINPTIISESVKLCYLSCGEGCLSVDDVHEGRVYRKQKILVKAYDVDEGKVRVITARGYEAIVLQHEIDHLNGILYYDRIDKKDPQKEIPGSIAI